MIYVRFTPEAQTDPLPRDRIRALHAEHCRDQAGDTEALIGKLENVYRCVELQARLATLKQGRGALPALPKLPPAPLDPTGRPPTASPPTASPPTASPTTGYRPDDHPMSTR